jgi:hypothetical protein
MHHATPPSVICSIVVSASQPNRKDEAAANYFQTFLLDQTPSKSNV